MTNRQLKQKAVKENILLRRIRDTIKAIDKNGGPITQAQIERKQIEKITRRQIYVINKIRANRKYILKAIF